jgi:PIN domain nuclease of toxin-antitoxin system
VRLLLDTHALLWMLLEPERLSERAKSAAASPSNLLLASIASLWELTIKLSAGKLKLPGSDVRFLTDNLSAFGIDLLPVLPAHLHALQQLPHHHRDPFDRMLIAQSQAEQVALLTADTHIARYQVDVLW